jgi:hypothetical protein
MYELKSKLMRNSFRSVTKIIMRVLTFTWTREFSTCLMNRINGYTISRDIIPRDRMITFSAEKL